MRIGIIGCGIAGQAAAIGLSRDGHDVTVVERFAAARPVGAGLLLQPSGLQVLERLGAREEAERWGFFNRLCTPEAILADAQAFAHALAHGPTFAHGMTKKMLQQEWAVGIDEAIEMEAQAQAICMQTKDFHRAYNAFVAKKKPVFEGD